MVKSTNNNLEFGGTRVFASEVELNQFPIIYDGTQSDPFGQTTIENTFVFSPGGITGANNNESFRVGVLHSSPDYFYDRISLTRITLLPAQ